MPSPPSTRIKSAFWSDSTISSLVFIFLLVVKMWVNLAGKQVWLLAYGYFSTKLRKKPTYTLIWKSAFVELVELLGRG